MARKGKRSAIKSLRGTNTVLLFVCDIYEIQYYAFFVFISDSSMNLFSEGKGKE